MEKRKRRKFTPEKIKEIQSDRKSGLGWKATLDKHKISGSTLLRIDKLSGKSKVASAQTALKRANGERRRTLVLSVDQETYRLMDTLSHYLQEPQPVFGGRLLKEQLQEVMRKAAKENA